jgi:hypothetical protein
MFAARYPFSNVIPRDSRNVEIGGYTALSLPLIRNPRSFIAAATAPIAVPQMPMK